MHLRYESDHQEVRCDPHELYTPFENDQVQLLSSPPQPSAHLLKAVAARNADLGCVNGAGDGHAPETGRQGRRHERGGRGTPEGPIQELQRRGEAHRRLIPDVACFLVACYLTAHCTCTLTLNGYGLD